MSLRDLLDDLDALIERVAPGIRAIGRAILAFVVAIGYYGGKLASGGASQGKALMSVIGENTTSRQKVLLSALLIGSLYLFGDDIVQGICRLQFIGDLTRSLGLC